MVNLNNTPGLTQFSLLFFLQGWYYLMPYKKKIHINNNPTALHKMLQNWLPEIRELIYALMLLEFLQQHSRVLQDKRDANVQCHSV